MESAVFPRVRQRFVARVDDGAVELLPFKQVVIDILRALADLEMAVGAVPQQTAAQLRARSRTDPARSGEEQTQRQKRQQCQHVVLRQWSGPAHEVVFMATEGRAGVMVHVVADEADLIGQMHLLERLQQNRVSGPIIAKQVNQRKTLGRAILQMAHVHISPPSVEQKTAVASLLVPVPLMHIRQTETVLPANPIPDPADGTGRTGGVVGQTTVLCFQANDAVHKLESAGVSSS